MDFTCHDWIEVGMLFLVGDVAVGGGWSAALGVSYVSLCFGDIGYVATCVELWLPMVEVPLSLS